jgi:ribosomal protein S18 acetylase RimI-like enzyme
MDMKVDFIKPEETHELRHRVLRPHQKIEDCNYPGDNTATTFHLGIKENETLVCIGSLYLETNTEFTEPDQYRLRGMATDPDFRGRNFGRKLIDEMEKILTQRGATFVWCYAREKAFDFYTKVGFKIHGPFFEVPGIGRHKVMFKHLSSK